MAPINRAYDAFCQAVERALEHFAEPEWLGAQSPLAAPYFLGSVLDTYPDSDTAVGRGRALRDVLRQAAAQLATEPQQLLEVSFFRRDANLTNLGVARKLDYSEATYYRHRTRAIEALAGVVSQQLLPPLRPETPQRRAMVGREPLLAACLQALRAAHSVAITGPGGIGKSTFGLALRAAWGEHRTFWFTLRPGLNDQLSSLVFALGYFLRGLGAANTWRQLVADHGALNIDRVMGLIRHDLASLGHDPPLLCVDELDLLRRELYEHAQILHLLEELRESAPIVLLGQQLVIEPYQHHVLDGFSPAEVAQLLEQAGMGELSPLVQHQLSEVTRGNPALLTLLLPLYRAGEPLNDMLAALAVAPSLELVLQRVWKRLAGEERALLMALSVFRSFAPQDAWLQVEAVLMRLAQYGLVERDGRGGVAVLPYARLFVYQQAPADLRTTLHAAAAQIRESRSEYTAAAYHYVAAQQPALGVWIWFNHRTEEIDRGHSGAARALFNDVAYSALSTDEDRRALAIVRTELLKLAGTAEAAEAELAAVTWAPTHPIMPYIHQLYGDLLTMQEGRQTQALEHYRLGLEQLESAVQLREIDLLIRRSYIYGYHLLDWTQARHEAVLAQLKAEDFLGNIEEEAGNYAAARVHYETALTVAEREQGTLRFQIRIHSNLGRLTWRQGDHTTAITHLEWAIQHAEMRGDTIGVLHDQVNLSGAYIVAGRYADALEQALSGLQLAESLRHAYLSAGLAANAGEACYYLNRLDEAEHYSLRSLQLEEDAHRPYALTVLGLVQGARRQFDAAARSLQSAIESAVTGGDKYATAAAWRVLGDVYGDQQDIAQAQNAFEQAWHLYRELGLVKEAEDMRNRIREQKLEAFDT